MAYSADLRREFKQNARQRIRESFWPAMGAVLLMLIPSALISVIYNVCMPSSDELANGGAWGMYFLTILLYFAAAIFIIAPISFGAKHYFVARARGQQASPTLTFGCFGDGMQYKNALKILFSIIGRSIGWIVLEIAIAAAAVFLMTFTLMLALYGDGGELMMILVWALSIVGLLAVSMWVSVKIRRYDGAYIRMIDDPTQSAWQVTGECAATFREHNWELFVFDLSFILWGLLSIVTLGIASIYLTAYTEIAFINYFDALCEFETGVPRMQAGTPETAEALHAPEAPDASENQDAADETDDQPPQDTPQ